MKCNLSRIFALVWLAVSMKMAFAGFPGNVLEAGSSAVNQVVQAPVQVIETGKQAVDHVVNEGKKQISQGEKELGNVANDYKNLIDSIGNEAKIALSNAEREQKKLLKDAIDNTVKGLSDVVDATQAAGRFVEREIAGIGESVNRAEKRLVEGKVVDAFWHLSTDQVAITSNNAGKMAQENELIRTSMASAATAYGGPAGSAAFSAWFAYTQTEDVDMALRVGVIAGLQSAAIGSASQMPSGSAGELAKKALVMGAIGGVAVAAAGGDQNAVRDAFIKQGGMVVVQAGQEYLNSKKAVVAEKMDTMCVSAVSVKCSPALEAFKVDSKGQVILDAKGLPKMAQARLDENRKNLGSWATARNIPVDRKVIGVDGMVLKDQKWAITWSRDAFTSKTANVPAVALTYVGPGSTFEHQSNNVLAILTKGANTEEGVPALGSNRPSHWVALQSPGMNDSYFSVAFKRVFPAGTRPLAVGDIAISNLAVNLREGPAVWKKGPVLKKGAVVQIVELTTVTVKDTGTKQDWARIEIAD